MSSPTSKTILALELNEIIKDKSNKKRKYSSQKKTLKYTRIYDLKQKSEITEYSGNSCSHNVILFDEKKIKPFHQQTEEEKDEYYKEEHYDKCDIHYNDMK